MEKIRLMSLFSGFGGPEFALQKANIDYEVVGYSEIDKYAIQMYEQNHGDIKNYGDCTKINPKELPDFDLLTGGFPCQAFSQAGSQQGELDPRGTLFYEIIRIAEVKKPKWMVLENVEGLTTSKFRNTFNKILEELYRIGYNVSYKLLNTKDYGIPQNRNRIIFVCYRDDLEMNFEFPEKEKLTIFLKDILEKEVDKKYYLNENQLSKIKSYYHSMDKDIVKTISASDNMKMSKRMNFCDENKINTLLPNTSEISQPNRVYLSNGLSPTLDSTNKITIGDFRYDEGFRPRKDGNSPTLCSTMRESSMSGGMPIIIQNKSLMLGNLTRYETANRSMEFSQSGVSWCLTGSNDVGTFQNNSIRRLTPRECFRLQGFLKDEIKFGSLSDSQLYKICGNGWSINVFQKVFEKMFIHKRKPKSLFDYSNKN